MWFGGELAFSHAKLLLTEYFLFGGEPSFQTHVLTLKVAAVVRCWGESNHLAVAQPSTHNKRQIKQWHWASHKWTDRQQCGPWDRYRDWIRDKVNSEQDYTVTWCWSRGNTLFKMYFYTHSKASSTITYACFGLFVYSYTVFTHKLHKYYKMFIFFSVQQLKRNCESKHCIWIVIYDPAGLPLTMFIVGL